MTVKSNYFGTFLDTVNAKKEGAGEFEGVLHALLDGGGVKVVVVGKEGGKLVVKDVG
jgi:hypothetical protein